MKKSLLAVLFGAVLVLGACGGGDDNADDNAKENENGGTVDTAAAEEIYQSNCSACHGSDLSGGAGPELANIGSKYSAEEITDIIHNGIGSMPAQKGVSDQDATTLANWLAEKK
ncbi:cytochrome c551 [Virgibacillus sp. MG-45]|uniref:cytochrome c551 n=1 Tax=Virgibacillus sp. MG-45 TaxID=3102791 RepID=UPI002ED7E427